MWVECISICKFEQKSFDLFMFLQNEGGAKILVTNGDARMTILGCVDLFISGGNGLILCLLNMSHLGKETKRRTKNLYDGENFVEQQTRDWQPNIIQVAGVVGQIGT